MKLKMSQVLENGDQSLQITGSYIENWNGKKASGYCAIGLLSCACNNVEENGMFKMNEHAFLRSKYTITEKRLSDLYECPVCETFEGKDYISSIISVIIHLNDEHHYTYKQIAGYLKKNKL